MLDFIKSAYLSLKSTMAFLNVALAGHHEFIALLSMV